MVKEERTKVRQKNKENKKIESFASMVEAVLLFFGYKNRDIFFIAFIFKQKILLLDLFTFI